MKATASRHCLLLSALLLIGVLLNADGPIYFAGEHMSYLNS